MSLRKDAARSADEVSSFYDNLQPQWPGVETTPTFHPPFLGHAAYCTESLVPSTILTPISLPDSSFRPSPALSHHSPDYAPQDYRFTISESTQPQGLGITAAFPSEYPRTTAPSASYVDYAPDDLQYGLGDSSSISPQGPPLKRVKRALSQSSAHEDSKTVLPNPGGTERTEQKKKKTSPPAAHSTTAPRPGRGRRDPQAEEEDDFVEELRNQNTAWKVVREMFRGRFNKDASEARLQMRLLRRRERLQRWDEQDTQLLLNAAEIWEAKKYHFIAEKMKELGSTKDYSPKACKAQLKILESKQQGTRSVSPSALSDYQLSPTIPASRKRTRPHSQELE
ncbi:hypothetical protein N7470_000964 [Penicillium chermesinum]|nr:hypothetical protein N7470_000964 [Penicillium chermesinum]